MDRPPVSAWSRSSPGFPPAVRRAYAGPTYRMRSLRGLKRGSSRLLLDRVVDHLQLRLHQTGGQIESQGVFSEQPGFAIHAHVVAVILDNQALRFDNVGRGILGQAHELELKVDVLGLISWSIHVGYIGSHQFLPSAQQIHVLLNLIRDIVNHGVGKANEAPNGPGQWFSCDWNVQGGKILASGERLPSHSRTECR